MSAPELIHRLVRQFSENHQAYRSDQYKEAQLRQEFLNPFFEALGWDVSNRKGFSLNYREVIHEDSIHVKGSPNAKAPDYAFRLGGYRKFFVEAKKPAEDIKNDKELAYQLKVYAWNVGLPLSILTDFEEFAIYDCRNKPNPSDSPASARVKFIKYDEYIDRWDEIAGIFSPIAIQKGAFDKYISDNNLKKGTIKVDDAFLVDIEKWRNLLARNIALRNPHIANERQLNYAVQMTIDRIIFLRISEDRGIEPENQLYDLLEKKNIYSLLLELFHKADTKYNSGLFHFNTEKGVTNNIDILTPSIMIDDQILKQIVKSMYYPCPYVFKEIPVEILGQVYEQFLGKVIRLTPARHAKIEEKPEVRKAGGIYYTPKYIVDYIVNNTIGKQMTNMTPNDASKVKVIDPACGSGSFLLGAFQYLLDWHEKWYIEHEPEEWSKGKSPVIMLSDAGEWKLTTPEKKRILVNNIFGVDIDEQAVEVTKLSLLLKVLEEETGQLRLGFDRVLPDLGNNIICGNSLIAWDYFEGLLIQDDKEIERVNPFNWENAFPAIINSGGFDVVIGNPPYIFARSHGINEREKKYFYDKFSSQNYQLNTYSLFVEKAHSLLNSNGILGLIIPNNWLTINSMEKFRKFIINNSKDLTIVNNMYKVFLGANVDTSIIIYSHGKPTSITLFEAFGPNNIQKTSQLKPIDIQDLPIIPFISDDDYQKLALVRKIMENTIPLNKISEVKSGLKAYETGKGEPRQTDSMKENRVYHSEEKIDNTYRKYLQGKDVNRYWVDWSGQFLKYGRNLAAPRDSKIFANERILVRQIPSNPPYCINSVIVLDDSINDINSMIILKPENKYSLNYLLGIINSRLLSFWFAIFFGKFQRNIFPQFKVVELAKFPIHSIDFTSEEEVKKHEHIITLVKRVLELYTHRPNTVHEEELLNREISNINRLIDHAVYELYGLTDEEIAIVEGNV